MTIIALYALDFLTLFSGHKEPISMYCKINAQRNEYIVSLKVFEIQCSTEAPHIVSLGSLLKIKLLCHTSRGFYSSQTQRRQPCHGLWAQLQLFFRAA